MIKKLSVTGNIDPSEKSSDSSDALNRSAILVHSGPNGDAITFQSADGEISFDEQRINQIIENHNAKINDLAIGYGGLDKMPLGAFPPILDQHEDDSNNRIIGRLSGLLRFDKRNVPGVGENVACILSDITFLGKETVERVNDGRIYHLSIGIDEDTNTLAETSTVITPAAPGAMLLEKGKKIIQKPRMEKVIMSKQLQAHAKKMAHMKAMRDTLTEMKGKLSNANEHMKLTKRKGEITHRLTTIMRAGKLTPAEYKKLNLNKLARLSEDSANTVMEAFEAMEPKVMAGQKGTTDAIDFATMGKSLEKRQVSRLKSETVRHLKKLGARLKSDYEDEDKDHGDSHQMEGGNDVEHESPGASEGAVPGQAGYEKQLAHAKHMAHMVKQHMEMHHLMAKHLEGGDVESAKEHHEGMLKHCSHMMKHMGQFPGAGHDESEEEMKHLEISDVKSEDYKKANDTLQAQVDELNTQVARMAGMMDELMSAEKEEGEAFQKEADSHKGLEGEVKEDVEKKMKGKKMGEKEEKEKKE